MALPARPRARRVLLSLACASALVSLVPLPAARAVSPDVVISQVYGGGGNTGAPFKNDFIELFNRAAAPVDVTGWSVQYASSTGSNWQKTALTGVIQPGAFYLVQEAAGAGTASPLPTPNAIGSIPMSATTGKVALVNHSTTLAGTCPTGLVDFVGYGAANCAETSPTPALVNTTAALRNGNGSVDTDNNAADFTVGTPNPRSTLPSVNPTGVGAASPASVPAGANVALTVAVTPAQGPTSTGLAVTADLSPIGASAAQPFLDDGSGGDVVAGDLVFTFVATVSATTATGSKTLNVTILDAQARTGSTTIALSVEPPAIAIHDIQGPGNASPLAGQVVATTGIVTGLRTNGFFLQAPDADADGNANTSEGIFVFTSSAPTVAVGDGARVAGKVQEYVPSGDPSSPPMTELVGPLAVTKLSSGNPLPLPVALTSLDTDPAGGIAQLEKLEGMRVEVDSLTVVGPTGGSVTSEVNATATSNGVFYGVLDGIDRPFREPGIETPTPPPAGAPCCVPVFDANPERLRVDSDGLVGAPKIEVAAGQVVQGLVGPLDYAFRTYTLLPDPGAPPVVTGDVPVPPVREADDDEVTVASFNLLRFFDAADETATNEPVLSPTAFANRLQKASLAIRDVLRSPDILGVQEVENLATLQALAGRINADAVAGGAADPGYAAYLIEGNDVGGIDVGFLVKATRVSVVDVTQEGKDATFVNPVTGLPELLNDRPPLVLRADFIRPGTAPLPVTVIVNHLRSLNGIEDPAEGPRVRAKRQAQAEFLAGLVQDRQAADPEEHIASVGDYNAYPFNDGYVDVMGTIVGDPTPAEEVVLASPDLVNPDLTNLLDTLPPAERYSYVFDGNAQAFDQVLVSSSLQPLVRSLQYARANADFPAALFNDPTRPERLTDHDAPVAYFRFPQADLSLTKAASTPAVPSGTTLTFTIVVANAGPDPAATVELADVLPAGTTFRSLAPPADWTCTTPTAGGTGAVACATPLLAAGASATFALELDVTCEVPVGTVLSNTATVLGQTGDPNPANNTATATATASNLPPVITDVAATPSTLWPPNHQMVLVKVGYDVADQCGVPVCRLAVTSDEPRNGRGDGCTIRDWKVIDDHKVLLRAERSAHGDGRVYTIAVTCTDADGGAATATTTVRVPKSQGPKPKPPKR